MDSEIGRLRDRLREQEIDRQKQREREERAKIYPQPHHHFWHPQLDTNSQAENRDDDVTTLDRSLYGYIDRSKAYRRLKEWQYSHNLVDSQAVVMICRHWERCRSPLV